MLGSAWSCACGSNMLSMCLQPDSPTIARDSVPNACWSRSSWLLTVHCSCSSHLHRLLAGVCGAAVCASWSLTAVTSLHLPTMLGCAHPRANASPAHTVSMRTPSPTSKHSLRPVACRTAAHGLVTCPPCQGPITLKLALWLQRAASKARDKAQADAEADKAPPAPKVEAGAGAAPAAPQAADDSKAVEAGKAGTQAAEAQPADKASEAAKPKAEAGKEEPAGSEEKLKGDTKEGAEVRSSLSRRAWMVLHEHARPVCHCLHKGAWRGQVQPSGPCVASAPLWTCAMSCLVQWSCRQRHSGACRRTAHGAGANGD